MWWDIAAIVFVCTTVNHLGLVEKIESIIKREIPVVNCPRCFTCWSVLFYLLVTGFHPLASLAISLLASYAAIWLELTEGIIDYLYDRIYEQIYPTADTTADNKAGANGEMPELRIDFGDPESSDSSDSSE